jgi:hypothetical protein
MRWRDIRFEKPTKADADSREQVLVLHKDETVCKWNLTNAHEKYCVAWMPPSELPAFDPIPDPPEGWTWADKSKPFDKRAKFWTGNDWIHTLQVSVPYSNACVYIVPIDPPAPPEPQYRPYTAAELKQTIGKLVDGVSGYRAMITGACGDSVYCQGQRVPADQLLKNHTWTDGGKCGVKVD